MSYASPPIREAIFEAFGASGAVIPTENLITEYQRAFPEFTGEIKYFRQVGITIENDIAKLNEAEPLPPRCQISSSYNDRNEMIQFSYQMFALNVFKPYGHFDNDYKPMLKRLLAVYNKVSPTDEFNIIGQRYINEITVPLSDKVSDFFSIYPQDNLKKISNSRFQLQFEYQTKFNFPLYVNLQRSRVTSTDQVFTLDLYAQKKNVKSNEQDFFNWFDQSHSELKELFESIITETTRKSFNLCPLNQ